MDVDGFPWISMDIHGYPWISMDIRGNPWVSMEVHGNPWKYTEIHGQFQQAFKLAENREKQLFTLFAFLPPYIGVLGFLV